MGNKETKIKRLLEEIAENIEKDMPAIIIVPFKDKCFNLINPGNDDFSLSEMIAQLSDSDTNQAIEIKNMIMNVCLYLIDTDKLFAITFMKYVMKLMEEVETKTIPMTLVKGKNDLPN